MSSEKWSTKLSNDESLVNSTTELISLQDGNINKRIKVSVSSLGQSVIPIHKLSDLPPLINEFRTFKQDFVYLFVENITSIEPLLIPAGWTGSILGVHDKIIEINRTGTGPTIQTLNISGLISSIAGGEGVIIVTTSATHGLLDGQFVNITGTTSYNQQHLVISNVTDTTFDVQTEFGGDESGAFDTGYNTINIANIGFTNNNTADWLDITAADTLSLFSYYNIRASGFENLGTIRKGRMRGYGGDFDFSTEGPVLEDIDDAILSATTLLNTDLTSISAKLLTLTGSLTRDINLDTVKFKAADPSQFPVRIDSTINNADRISITNSPDNNVATDYFDTSSGGLDQTDTQVFTFNNGKRPNSSIESESRSDGVLEVDGTGITGTPVAIVDVTPSPGDFVLDSASQGFSMDTSTGIVTYNGLIPRTVLIGYSLEAAQTSGGAQNLVFDLRINGLQQSKTIRVMGTMGADSFVLIVSLGGFFNINPNDTFQLFKTNTTNTTNSDVQNTVLLIR